MLPDDQVKPASERNVVSTSRIGEDFGVFPTFQAPPQVGRRLEPNATIGAPLLFSEHVTQT